MATRPDNEKDAAERRISTDFSLVELPCNIIILWARISVALLRRVKIETVSCAPNIVNTGYKFKVGGGTGQNGHCVIVDTSIAIIHSRGL